MAFHIPSFRRRALFAVTVAFRKGFLALSRRAAAARSLFATLSGRFDRCGRGSLWAREDQKGEPESGRDCGGSDARRGQQRHGWFRFPQKKHIPSNATNWVGNRRFSADSVK
jgi:hypothetical protein